MAPTPPYSHTPPWHRQPRTYDPRPYHGGPALAYTPELTPWPSLERLSHPLPPRPSIEAIPLSQENYGYEAIPPPNYDSYYDPRYSRSYDLPQYFVERPQRADLRQPHYNPHCDPPQYSLERPPRADSAHPSGIHPNRLHALGSQPVTADGKRDVKRKAESQEYAGKKTGSNDVPLGKRRRIGGPAIKREEEVTKQEKVC